MAATTVDEQTLDVGGIKVCVRRAGRGPALLFLHGAGAAGAWLPFHDLLAGDFSVIAPDHPGFGSSPDNELVEGVDDLVFLYRDAAALLGLDEVHVVGSSLGGWLAAELAVADPRLVRGLVLLNPVGLEIREHPLADLFGMTPEETVDAVFADPGIAAGLFPAEPDVDFIVQMYSERTVFARWAWSPYCANPKLERRLGRIACPALVVWGEKDGVVPREHAERYAERIPGARLEIMNGVAHAPFVEDPERTARLVTEFLLER